MTERASKKHKSILSSSLLGLSCSLWLELVFKHHLSIESGVALAGTCSFFWKSEKIREWLREKEIEVFGDDVPKEFWNKLQKDNSKKLSKIIYDTNLICLRYIYVTKGIIDVWFGVFSSKERLWKVFGNIIDAKNILDGEEQKCFFGSPVTDFTFKNGIHSFDMISIPRVHKKECDAILEVYKSIKKSN
jgi:hypothetical protein